MTEFPSSILNRIGREIRTLVTKPPTGITYLEDYDEESSFTDIHVHLEGPEGTPYQNTFYHVKLTLPQDFPQSPPNGYFLTRIYHPNVSPTASNSSTSTRSSHIPGYAICVNTLKRDWNKDVTLSHVLSIIRCLLIVPFPESSLNDEAGKLFMESYDDYAKRASLMAGLHAIKKSNQNKNQGAKGGSERNTKTNSRNQNRNLKNLSVYQSGNQRSPKNQNNETKNREATVNEEGNRKQSNNINNNKRKEKVEYEKDGSTINYKRTGEKIIDSEKPSEKQIEQEKDNKLLERGPTKNDMTMKGTVKEVFEKEQHENLHFSKTSVPVSNVFSQEDKVNNIEVTSSVVVDNSSGTPSRRQVVDRQGTGSVSPHSRGNCQFQDDRGEAQRSIDIQETLKQDMNKKIIQPNDQNNHNNSNTTKSFAHGHLKRKLLSCNGGETASNNKGNSLSISGKEGFHNLGKGKIGYHGGEPAPKRLKENQKKKGLKRL